MLEQLLGEGDAGQACFGTLTSGRCGTGNVRGTDKNPRLAKYVWQ